MSYSLKKYVREPSILKKANASTANFQCGLLTHVSILYGLLPRRVPCIVSSAPQSTR